ncbi:MAG: hypothetical protein KDD34_05270 [Bdellovibrionales bacterium]|nr:hypothetical protein [Bdellovibrionales bacterium]
MVDSSDQKQNENNVIHFPHEKVSPAKVIDLPVERYQPHKPSKGKWGLGAFLTVFMGAILLNSTDFSNVPLGDKQSRSLASVGQYETAPRDVHFEKSIAEKISQSSARQPASLGRQPSRADEFRFGFLESKYAVKFYQGKVQEVEFTNSSQNLEPRYLSDRQAFLNANKDLFAIPYTSTMSLNREVVGQKIHETYALLNSNQTKVGKISFELDIYGRLLGMKVGSVQ